METALQLAVSTPLDALRNREIDSNIKELLPVVQAKVAEYKSTVYGISQERTCREHRALLNKFQKAIIDETKAVYEANNEPFKRFQEEVEPIIAAVTDGIQTLDAQIAEMENLWRTRNIDNAKILYDSIIGTSKFASWLPWDKVLITKRTSRVTLEDFFGNKGTWNYQEGQEENTDLEYLKQSGKKVTETFNVLLKVAQEGLDIINSLDYPDFIKQNGIGYLQMAYDPINRKFDTEGAFTLMNNMARVEREKREAVERAKREAEAKAQREALLAQQRAEEEKRRALAEQQRQAEAEKQKAIQEAQEKARAEAEAKARAEAEAKKQEPVQMSVTDFIPQAEEKRYVLKFEAEMTITQAKMLREFCNKYGITLNQIK